MGGYATCAPTTYVVTWGDVWKVGYSSKQRWRKFALRGAEVVQLTAFEDARDALALEADLLADLAERGHPAFMAATEAVEFLGHDGAGWRECYCLCEPMRPHHASALRRRTAHASSGPALRPLDARTNERTDADNYSPCEDILLLSNAGEDKPIQVSLSPDDLHFIVSYDPERERSANRRDLVAVIEEIQALINDGVCHPLALEATA